MPIKTAKITRITVTLYSDFKTYKTIFYKY